MTLSLEQRIANLSPEKRALLEKRLLESRVSAATAPEIISRRQSEATIPLSFAQQRLWLLDQLYPGVTNYNTTSVYKLGGSLNRAALQQSLDEIVRRHESIRTTFRIENGEPVQVINPPTCCPIQWVELTQIPLSDRQAEIQRYATQEQKKPFDLRTDLLRRAMVLSFSSQEHVLFLTGHHIASDGWSNGVFWSELSALYTAFVAGKPSPLPQLVLQYADYALWQRQQLQGERLASEVGYWKNQLAKAPTMISLPYDFVRSVDSNGLGREYRFGLSPITSQKMSKLAREQNVTLYMFLLAAFQLLLMRYSNQQDIVVGSPIANRQRPELESLIGMFVNTLVLRTDLSGNPTFVELLQRVRTVTLEAYAHQDLPFEKLIEEIQPERTLNQQPLVQVMLSLQNTPKSPVCLAGLTTERLVVESESAKFDLIAVFNESESGIGGRFEYDNALFTSATIERIANHFVRLLDAIVANPNGSIEHFQFLSAQERQQQLVDWNQTTTDYPRMQSLHHLFQEVATRFADRGALSFADCHLSYRQLNQRANQLARALHREGVQSGDIVALCTQRSSAMVVAMLAILKVGAVYLPFDPSQPLARLQFILDDAQAKLILSDNQNHALSAKTQHKVLNVSQVLAHSDEVSEELVVELPSNAPAYIIYTSGSTGKPKGVVVPHRAVLRLVCNSNYITITPQDRIAQASNPMFDAATFEIWGALLNGATLVEVPTETLLSPSQLATKLQQQSISVLFVTTALFHRLVQVEPTVFQTLRVLLFGGEAVDAHWVRQVLAEGRPQHLLHVYGPTENCTFSTFHSVETIAEGAITIPIGKPIANSQAYILDRHLQPVPIGVIGELHCAGDGLAHGYLHRLELSGEKFVNNPFGKGLLYKTGDRARYLPDGAIEFAGRGDFQVKIRGFRVELAEIEATINAHTAVKESVVTTIVGEMGDKKLIAYVAIQRDQHLDEQRLSEYLKPLLPAYMIPSEIVLLDDLPLNHVGKVDRSALRKIAGKAIQPSQHLTARDTLESQLVEIWEAVLKIRPIGVRDSFFDLGGHSLMAVQLFDRISKSTGRTLPLATLFQTPTIEALATALRQQDWSPNWKTITPIRTSGSLPPLFVVPPAASTVLRFAPLLEHLAPELPIYGLQHRGLEDEEPPFTSVKEIAEHFVTGIRSLQPSGPYLLTGICFGAHVAFEIAQQLVAQGERIALLTVIDASPPANGPGWQFDIKAIPKRDWHIARWRMLKEEGAVMDIVFYYWRAMKRRFRSLLQQKSPHDEIKRVHAKAQKQYQASYYSGNCLLLQSDEFARRINMTRYWQTLVTGSFERIVIPGSTHSSLLLTKYHLQQLAEAMMGAIKRSLDSTNPIK